MVVQSHALKPRPTICRQPPQIGHIKALCDVGRVPEAIHALLALQQQGFSIPHSIFFCLIQLCTSNKDLDSGRQIHQLIKRTRLDSNASLAARLIRMFSVCRCFSEASQVFTGLPSQTVATWTAFISAHVTSAQHEEALILYDQMQGFSLAPDRHTFIAALKACASETLLKHGMCIHHHIIECGTESHVFVGNNLITMYTKCRSIDDAGRVFGTLLNKDVVTWNAMISGYVQHECGQKAYELLFKMQEDGLKPTLVTFLCALKACSSMEALYESRQVHDLTVRADLSANALLGTTLIDIYAKCGIMEDAHRVFDGLPKQDVATWNTLITGYAQQGHSQESLHLFKQMEEQGVEPDEITCLGLLKACANITDLEQGKMVDSLIQRHGYESKELVASTLIDMYAKCGSIEDAQQVFNRLSTRDIVAWNVMIQGYGQHGQWHEALLLFQIMQQEGMEPNSVTFVCILKAISTTESLFYCKLIHASIVEYGFQTKAFVGSTLIDLYAKCGSMQDAHMLFQKLSKPDRCTWNVMISGYAQHQHGEKALQLFREMQSKGMMPDEITFVGALRGCSSIATSGFGRLLHAAVVECGCESNSFIGSAMMDMYSKCGNAVDATNVFTKLPKQDALTWNTMILCHVHSGQSQDALQVFQQMQQKKVEIHEGTYVSALQACSAIGGMEQSKAIYNLIIESGFDLDIYVMSTLVDTYAKCGTVEDAFALFNRLSKRNLVTWTVMISAYALHGQGQKAFQIFEQMLKLGIEPNEATYVCILGACTCIAVLDQGRVIHDYIVQSDHRLSEVLGSALIDMYATCGSMEDACHVFDHLPKQDVVARSAMISGYAQCNNYLSAMQHFKDMQLKGLQPDVVTFVSLLSACSRVGLVDEVGSIIKSMEEGHGIVPTVDHYNCIVDLLGRGGHLEEAKYILQTVPLLSTNLMGWRSLLSHCQRYRVMELGERCFDHLTVINDKDAPG